MKQLFLFSASWCPTCQPVKKLLQEQATAVLQDINLVIVDMDVSPALASKYSIRSIPTMILFDGEAELKRKTGSCSKEQLEDFLV